MATKKSTRGQRRASISAAPFMDAAMPGTYEPQSSEYEQDDDGFREGDGVLRTGENSGLRSTHPDAQTYLQANCPRRHVSRGRARVCPLCLVEIPA